MDDTDDWGIDDQSFRAIVKVAGFPMDTDFFADPLNTRCPEFFSKFHCPGSAGTDAFSSSWEGKCGWMCPPTTKIVQTVKKILHSKGLRAVLIVPVWRSAVFWPFISPDGNHLTECFRSAKVFNPFIIPGEANSKSFKLMRGYTKFSFAALFVGKGSECGKLRAGQQALPKGMRMTGEEK